MKGDKKVIQFLNKALKTELTTINQYFLHARTCTIGAWKNLMRRISRVYRRNVACRSVDIEILFLEGLPNLQDLGKLYIGQNTHEMFEVRFKIEMTAVPCYAKPSRLLRIEYRLCFA